MSSFVIHSQIHVMSLHSRSPVILSKDQEATGGGVSVAPRLRLYVGYAPECSQRHYADILESHSGRNELLLRKTERKLGF